MNMNKIAPTTHAVFEMYDRRFAKAMAAIPERRPWIKSEKNEIISIARKCLGIKDKWIPIIRPETIRISRHPGFQIERIRFTSWPGVRGAAHLYVPVRRQNRQSAFVLLCCGHGPHGKLHPGYQGMARDLAGRGAMVLVPDNIGRGERAPMGHTDAIVPFACGMSLQGLIVMESIGWLRWALRDKRVDVRRVAAIGNSGGGTLTLFLGALAPEIQVLASSGYPSTFEFVARKEKKHCACNILPGMVGELEMWQLYGCFAPKPLFLFQGREDSLFPADIFYQTARKIKQVYERLKAADRFKAEVVTGQHEWDGSRIKLLGNYLAGALKLPCKCSGGCSGRGRILSEKDTCFARWPAGALTTAELAQRLTSVTPARGIQLWHIFPPRVNIRKIRQVTPRGDTRRILAQFEAFLNNRGQT